MTDKVMKSPVKRGRPCKLTAALQEKFYQAIIDFYYFGEACRISGISRSTGQRWRNKYPAFAAVISKAYDKYYENIDEEIERNRPVVFQGRRKYSTERHYPQRERDEKGRFI